MSTTRTSDRIESRNEMRDLLAGRKRSGPISSAQGRVLLHAPLLCLVAVSTAFADDLLVVHTDSLTAYKPGSASSVQDIRPMAAQRGVGIDGALRAGGSFGWAMQGNPFESAIAGETLEELRIATGAYAPLEIDLALPAEVPWIVGRTFNARQETSGGSHRDSNGYQGRNWFQTSQPELVFVDNDSNGGTRELEDLIYLVYGADRYIEFRRSDDDVDTFRGVNGAAGVIEYESGSPDVYVYYDLHGNRTYFFGGNTSGGADWQIWKFVDPAGNTAYVGDATTASTAETNGYDASGRILYAYDSADRRYSYSYSQLDTVYRLTEVKAETKTGGTWSNPTGVAEVGKVGYGYYQTGDNDHGDNGNLQLVTVTVPLSNTADSEVIAKRKHYRYWKGTYDATNNPGHQYTIKMSLGFEGVRRADWDPDGALDGSVFSEDDVDLKAYSDAYFKYDSSYRVVSVFFNGECGCGGGIDGEHKLTYANNPSFSNTSGYDTAWHRRVVVEPPTGGSWVTQYMDEVGQPLSRVLTDIDPTSSNPAPEKWVTQVVRNSDGQVTETHTPANITGYTHDSGGNPSGAITTSSSAGLAWYHERVSSGNTKGFLQGMRQKEGSGSLSTNSTYVSWTQYATRDLNIATGVNVTRPVVEKSRAFHTATTDSGASANYNETTRSFSWWSGTNTNVLYIGLKQVTTTAPTVSTGNNGSGSATSTKDYFRKAGTLAFTESARGIVQYIKRTNDQVAAVVEDAKTDTGTTVPYATGEHPNTDFGIASSTAGKHRITSHTYDAQGRLSTTILRDGGTPQRTTMKWYGRLGDDRLVTFNIPLVASYHGPAGGTVTNQSGETEECATIDITDIDALPEDWLKRARHNIRVRRGGTVDGHDRE